jgi:stage II sporulation protein R
LIVLILIGIIACPAQALEKDYVRLHVIASDDSAAAQALKLKVRDAVLCRARALLHDAHDAEAAWQIVRENADTFQAAARAVGVDATCETGVFPFPDRRYGDTLVPAGRYRALRVVIGAGQGRNWWCVLYPSLCYPEDWRTGEGFHSTLWDLMKVLFGGDRG